LTILKELGNIFFKINNCCDGKEYLEISIKANLGWWKLGYREPRKALRSNHDVKWLINVSK
jgi:hypothetical protein